MKRARSSETDRSADASAEPDAERLTLAAFGRRIGRSKSTVSAYRDAGLLDLDADGRVLVKPSIDRLREAGRLPAQAEAEPPPADDPALDALADRLARGDLLTWSEAERVKANYLARLRQLQYEREAERLCDVDTVATEVGRHLAIVRNRLLAMPQSIAPRGIQCTTAHELQELVFDEVRAALEELCDPKATAEKAARETKR